MSESECPNHKSEATELTCALFIGPKDTPPSLPPSFPKGERDKEERRESNQALDNNTIAMTMFLGYTSVVCSACPSVNRILMYGWLIHNIYIIGWMPFVGWR
jgi:hypothetical protein